MSDDREFPDFLAETMWSAYQAQTPFPRGVRSAFFAALEIGALYGRVQAEKAATDDASIDAVHDAAKQLGRRGGIKGGPSRAESLTPERRSEIAKHAAESHWSGR